jgi:hypothetical protein
LNYESRGNSSELLIGLSASTELAAARKKNQELEKEIDEIKSFIIMGDLIPLFISCVLNNQNEITFSWNEIVHQYRTKNNHTELRALLAPMSELLKVDLYDMLSMKEKRDDEIAHSPLRTNYQIKLSSRKYEKLHNLLKSRR